MPERPLTIATYAAGASLAAITLVYVFGPTFFLDGDAGSAHKKGVVGLANPANDCFINAVLQALAGLGDLRIYLIREVHRRKLDGPEVYKLAEEDREETGGNKDIKPWKVEGLRQGLVTKALKEVLDNLNERPIYRKTISARGFITVLEHAFRTRISRQQQDAQEFLHVVLERVCDEYHAGAEARRRARESRDGRSGLPAVMSADALLGHASGSDTADSVLQATKDAEIGAEHTNEEKDDDEKEEGFPFEGVLESQIECLTCHFKPKPTASSFVTLTLTVPQRASTSLSSCFDDLLRQEHIDDFKCNKCRLEHALDVKRRELSTSSDPGTAAKLQSELKSIQRALEEDPEKPPQSVELPDTKLAPKRRITRHTKISSFPKVLAIHLSRSIYSASSLSTKNMAKVAFPEALPLGSILDQRRYKLLGVVTHKGSHNSGHYESFRRQVASMPYSTPHSFGAGGAYSVHSSPSVSAGTSPRLSARTSRDSKGPQNATSDSSEAWPAVPQPSPSSLASPRSSLSSTRRPAPTSAPRDGASSQLPPSPLRNSPTKASSLADVARFKRKPKKRENRWWRISDDKVKESSTNEVLGLQKEVYLLFYELDRGE